MVHPFRTLLYSCLLVGVAFQSGNAQQAFVQNNDAIYTYRIEESLKGENYYHHTGIQPFLESDLVKYGKDSTIINLERKKGKFWKRISEGHALDYSKKWFRLAIDPSLHYETSISSVSGAALDYATGLRVRSDLGKMVTLFVDGRWGAFKPVQHVQDRVDSRGVVPFNDLAYAMGSGYYNYFDVRGYASITPSKMFNAQLGYDKLFVGNGHRSLLLSDNADKYAFLRLNTRFWRIKYTNVFAFMKDIHRTDLSRRMARNKFVTMHHLSINVGKRFNFSMFEAIVWQGSDSTSSRGFEPNYINPIIFYRPVEFSLNSPDNVFLGFDIRYRFGKNNHIYGQIIMDEFYSKDFFASLSSDSTRQTGFWGNKQGFQLGLKGYDLFGINGLYYQFEFNYVRPFTYAHISSEQSYSHRNGELAHPLGANFIESVSILRYQKGGLIASVMFNYSEAGRDSTDGISWGGNIFRGYQDRNSEYGYQMLKGHSVKTIFSRVELAYIVNPTMNLRIYGGVSFRKEWTPTEEQFEFYPFLGLSTSLYRQTVDY